MQRDKRCFAALSGGEAQSIGEPVSEFNRLSAFIFRRALARAHDDVGAADAPAATRCFSHPQQGVADLNEDVYNARQRTHIGTAVPVNGVSCSKCVCTWPQCITCIFCCHQRPNRLGFCPLHPAHRLHLPHPTLPCLYALALRTKTAIRHIAYKKSNVTRHTSHVERRTSHVTRHTSPANMEAATHLLSRPSSTGDGLCANEYKPPLIINFSRV